MSANDMIGIAKTVTSTIVAFGVSKITRTIIANNVQPENTVEEVTVTAGSVVIGMMAADASKTYTDAKIDEFVDAVRNIRSAVEQNKKN